MEFMDRRNRSLLVQFWLTVESFKNPLESVESETSGDEDDPIKNPSSSTTAKEDTSMVYELYFSTAAPHPSLSCISAKHVSSIRDFVLNEDTPSLAMERKARRSVMLAQRQVEESMEQDFEDLERSELWFRVVEDINATRKVSAGTRHTGGTIRRREPSATSDDTVLEISRRRAATAPVAPPMQRSDSTPSFYHLFGANHQLFRSDSASPTPIASAESSHSPTPPPNRSVPSSLDVLMSPVAETDSVSSRAPLFDDPDDRTKETRESHSTVEAIQAALTDIIAVDNQQTARRRKPPSSNAGSLFESPVDLQESTLSLEPQQDPPLEDADQEDDRGDDNHGRSESLQLAGPGDLQLSYEIQRLADKVSSLETQRSMLDTLIKNAELTGDTQELALLRKSKSALNREHREVSFQRTQYEQQELANRLLPDRTKLTIVNSTTAEDSGKAVVRYLIEVQQLASDGSFATGWVVARRYNEFLAMHNKLRERYALVRNLDFPGKRLVTNLSATFVDNRRTALEKYIQVRFASLPSPMHHAQLIMLQNLIVIPAVCESDELRAFLSRNSPFEVANTDPVATSKGASSTNFPGKDLVRTMYNSVAQSVDDMFFGPSMLDVMIQRLTRQAADLAGVVGSAINDEDIVAQALRASGKTASDEALLQFSGDLKPLDGETSSSTFSAPICDLLLAIFELNKKNNWLRRQAIVIILQQVLGSTVERFVAAASLHPRSHHVDLLDILQENKRDHH